MGFPVEGKTAVSERLTDAARDRSERWQAGTRLCAFSKGQNPEERPPDTAVHSAPVCLGQGSVSPPACTRRIHQMTGPAATPG